MKNEPVAWGMLDSEGGIYDTICPEEHDREEGDYTIPLYTHPAKTLTDEEIIKVHVNTPFIDGYLNKNLIEFARAILRKAQDERK
jgi:hypothetical protein